MTPNNLVNFAVLLGIQVIALTDHNTARNVEAVQRCACKAGGPLVIAGMEVETKEEVHLVCLFSSARDAIALEQELEPLRSPVKNQPNLFGNQILMDEADQPVGAMEPLLITALELPIDKAAQLVHQHGGLVFAAHVDRDSNSVLSNLGFIDPEWQLDGIEFSKQAVPAQWYQQHPELLRYPAIQDSDAHRLEGMMLPCQFLEWPVEQKLTEASFLKALMQIGPIV